MAESIIIALLICILNAVAALYVIRKAQKKVIEKFTKIVLSSLVIRYFIVVILVWLCLKVLELHQLAFSLTFMISTFLLIIAEILYINYRSNFINLQNHLSK